MADRTSNFANAFQTTLSAPMAATDLVATVASTANAPTSPCYLVIDPEDASKREYIFFDGSFTGTSFSATVLANRYLDGSAAGSGIVHDEGAVVKVSPMAQMFEDLHDRITADATAEAAALAAHEADTTGVHGIADTSVLATDAEVATAVSDHAAAADPHAGYVLESLIDAAGDLIVGSAADTVTRLAAGTDGQVLTVQADGTLAYETPASSATSSLLACTSYRGGSDTSYSTTSTTAADVDAVNLAAAFTVPDSGAVLVRLTGAAGADATTTQVSWALRDASGNVANSTARVDRPAYASESTNRRSYAVKITGLTPGASLTYKWAWLVSGGTGRLYHGPTLGPLVVEVWSA